MSIVISAKTNAKQAALGLSMAPERFHKAQVGGAKEVGREMLRRFRRTTSAWHHKPEFELITDITPDGVELLAGTDDEIYGFVSRGTSVRRAVMSKGWVSKTSPGSLTSGPGRGHVVFISKKITRPGIEARNFDGQIKNEIDPIAAPIIDKHISREANKRFV